jgi:hypothetical protein
MLSENSDRIHNPVVKSGTLIATFQKPNAITGSLQTLPRFQLEVVTRSRALSRLIHFVTTVRIHHFDLISQW